MKRLNDYLTFLVLAPLATLHAAAPPPPNFVVVPDKTQELNHRLTDYLTAVDARMP